MFFSHADSLVVHWRNKYNRQRVESVVDTYFQNNGIVFANREVRSTQGFDTQDSSHTELISKAIEKLLAKEPNVKNASESQLKPWLQKWIKHFNNMNPKQLLDFISS